MTESERDKIILNVRRNDVTAAAEAYVDYKRTEMDAEPSLALIFLLQAVDRLRASRGYAGERPEQPNVQTEGEVAK